MKLCPDSRPCPVGCVTHCYRQDRDYRPRDGSWPAKTPAEAAARIITDLLADLAVDDPGWEPMLTARCGPHTLHEQVAAERRHHDRHARAGR